MTDQLAKKRTGRPPKGSGTGDEPARIRDYPKLLITIRPAVKAKLKAIARVESRPAWQVVEDAVTVYFNVMPRGQRREIQTLLRDD